MFRCQLINKGVTEEVNGGGEDFLQEIREIVDRVDKEQHSSWNAPAPPGVVKIGDGRGSFMYCSHCQTGICGGCSIDLGMTAGCPICGTELLYMDGGSQ